MKLTDTVKEADLLMKEIFRFTNASALKSRSGPVVILQCGDKCKVAASVAESANNTVKVSKIEQAKQYISNNEVRLFVLDMHEKDYGMELLETLKANHPELPIIVSITDDSFREEIEKNFPDVEVIHEGAIQCEFQQVLNNLSQTPAPHWTTLLLKETKA